MISTPVITVFSKSQLASRMMCRVHPNTQQNSLQLAVLLALFLLLYLVLCRRATPLLTLQLRTLQSQNETVCCVAAEEDMANVGVRSAGFADGNEAG